MTDAPNLAAMVAAKVCHDVLSPVTGLQASLEMLKTDAGNPELIALAEEGVALLWTKLAFHRFALGGATTQGDGALDEAREPAEKLFAHLKADLKWSAPPTPMPHAAVRVIANLLYIAGDCLPRGGTVEIDAKGGEVRIVGTGRVNVKPHVGPGLRGETPEAELSGQIVHPTLTRLFADRAGLAIELNAEAERIELIARSAQIGRASAAA